MNNIKCIYFRLLYVYSMSLKRNVGTIKTSQCFAGKCRNKRSWLWIKGWNENLLLYSVKQDLCGRRLASGKLFQVSYLLVLLLRERVGCWERITWWRRLVEERYNLRWSLCVEETSPPRIDSTPNAGEKKVGTACYWLHYVLVTDSG